MGRKKRPGDKVVSNRGVEYLQGEHKKGEGEEEKNAKEKEWVPFPLVPNTVMFLFFSHPFLRLSHKLDVKHCCIESTLSKRPFW